MNPADGDSGDNGADVYGDEHLTTAPRWGESLPEKIQWTAWVLRSHPQIYRQFAKFAAQFRAARPKSTLSGDLLMNQMRWFSAVNTVGDNFKVNSNIRSVLIRLFVWENPDAKFDLRQSWLDVLHPSEWDILLTAHHEGQNAHASKDAL
jgi:hypothetical protein